MEKLIRMFRIWRSGGMAGELVRTPIGTGMIIEKAGKSLRVMLAKDCAVLDFSPCELEVLAVNAQELSQQDRDWLASSLIELGRWRPCWETGTCTVRQSAAAAAE